MVSGAVGDRVRGSVEQRSEGHDHSGYAIVPSTRWHWPLVAVAAVWGTWAFENGMASVSGRGGLVVLALAPWMLSWRSARGWSALAILLVSVVGWRSASEWREVRTVGFGDVDVVATLASDVEPFGRGARVVLSIEGRRFETALYGSMAGEVTGLERGESVRVVGRTRPTSPDRLRRAWIRHVVGAVEVRSISEPDGGVRRRQRALERSANDVRDVMSRGAAVMSDDDAALFRGLVYGDDSAQSDAMVDRFRTSGLAHLTAVSGQNVGYVTTILMPLLSRRGRWTRLAVTLGVLAWFAVLTRVEPSVVRAAGMAAISAVGLSIGWRPRAVELLSICLVVFLVVDPFLVWSVGWWLSVSGTFGLVMGTPWIHRAITDSGVRRRRLADWTAPTIAAQLGVLPVSVAVFGWPSALAVPANLLAAPVAGIVMLIGIPTSLLAGSWSSVAGIVMFPSAIAVRWVDAVARVASRLDPPTMVDMAVTALVPLSLVALWRSSRHRCAKVG